LALNRQFGESWESIGKLLQAFDAFSPKRADGLLQEFESDIKGLVHRIASSLYDAVSDILEEKYLSQEDEDSSLSVLLLMQLRDRAASPGQRWFVDGLI
jgi:hypothetical protein